MVRSQPPAAGLALITVASELGKLRHDAECLTPAGRAGNEASPVTGGDPTGLAGLAGLTAPAKEAERACPRPCHAPAQQAAIFKEEEKNFHFWVPYLSSRCCCSSREGALLAGGMGFPAVPQVTGGQGWIQPHAGGLWDLPHSSSFAPEGCERFGVAAEHLPAHISTRRSRMILHCCVCLLVLAGDAGMGTQSNPWALDTEAQRGLEPEFCGHRRGWEGVPVSLEQAGEQM